MPECTVWVMNFLNKYTLQNLRPFANPEPSHPFIQEMMVSRLRFFLTARSFRVRRTRTLLVLPSELRLRMTREHLLECLVDDFEVGKTGSTVNCVVLCFQKSAFLRQEDSLIRRQMREVSKKPE